jgi:hypothetical protein
MHAYDADIFIPEFKGLRQYGDPVDGDLRYSPDCHDAETIGGVLQPAAEQLGFSLTYNGNPVFYGVVDPTPPPDYSPGNAGRSRLCTMMSAVVTHLDPTPMTANAVTIKEDGEDPITIIGGVAQGKKYWLYIFAIDNELYTASLEKPIREYVTDAFAWGEIAVGKFSGTFSRSRWSWCTYEMNFPEITPPPYRPRGRTNILVLSNPEDGLYYCYNDYNLVKVTSAPCNFRFIARYAERIWGCGTGEGKDSIFYSRPYSADNWSMDEDIPEDGGGYFRNATFDDDAILGIQTLGDTLIAFSKERAWRISGTDPSNFIIQEQYGNGTKYPETIETMGDIILMLGDHGMMAYDGNIVQPFQQEATWELLKNITKNPKVAEQRPVAIRSKEWYIIALDNELITNYPDTGKYQYNKYRLIVYNRNDGTVNQTEIPEIMDFCMEDGEAYAASTDQYGHVKILPLQFDSWALGRPSYKDVHWSTPWIMMNRKDIRKGGFDIYIQPEIQAKYGETRAVKFTVSIQTEKKTKTKVYNAYPAFNGKEEKTKRIHISNTGRRFRLILDVDDNGLPWRLIGGIHIIAETDKD